MRRGFTLIEVMVVLSILAIIAILAYNFFGNTMKDAATKQAAVALYRQMDLIEKGFDSYVLKHGDIGNIYVSVPNYKSVMVNDGHMREFPVPDPDWASADNTCTSGYRIGSLGWYVSMSNFAGTAENELYYMTYCLSEDICREFNRLYTDGGDTIYGSRFDVELHGGRFCVDAQSAAPPDNNYMVIGIAEIR